MYGTIRGGSTQEEVECELRWNGVAWGEMERGGYVMAM